MRFINLLILLLGQVLYLTAQESIVENVRVSQEGDIIKINYDLMQNSFVNIIILENGIKKFGFNYSGDLGYITAGTSRQITLIPKNGTLVCNNCIFRVVASGHGQQEIIIGQQIWQVNNLNVSKFRNGDPIAEASTVEEWQKAGFEKRPAWCYYNNDTVNGKKYGKLYNWYAINDPRGLAPTGWHIPSDKEWNILIEYLGGSMVFGINRKSVKGNERLGWKFAKDQSGDNMSGFSALQGGMRVYDGSFAQIEKLGYWWSADVIQSDNKSLGIKNNLQTLMLILLKHQLYINSEEVSLYYVGSQIKKNADDKSFGLSVRILRD
jgi:uncharacterized protein (TIGR02145 family)